MKAKTAMRWLRANAWEMTRYKVFGIDVPKHMDRHWRLCTSIVIRSWQ